MRVFKNALLFLTAVVSADSYSLTKPAPISPAPGGLSSTLKVSSLKNILQLGAPLTANEVFKNATFELDF